MIGDNDHRRACIAKTGCKLIARHNGRAFAVPAFTNDVSPAASTLSPLGQRGEGVALLDCEVTPALVSLNLHEVQ